MSVEDVRLVITAVPGILALFSMVWVGGRMSKALETLSELSKDHEARIRAVEGSGSAPRWKWGKLTRRAPRRQK